MNFIRSIATTVVSLFFVLGASAQQSSTPQPSPAEASPSTSAHMVTVRGCLQGERGNYVLVEKGTSLTYVLKGVGSKLDGQIQHEVEVKGQLLPGTIKTGVRAEKAGSNPSDIVHGVDGVPLQVANLSTDVRTIAKHCKAADQE